MMTAPHPEFPRGSVGVRFRAQARVEPDNWDAALMISDPAGHWVHFRELEAALSRLRDAEQALLTIRDSTFRSAVVLRGIADDCLARIGEIPK